MEVESSNQACARKCEWWVGKRKSSEPSDGAESRERPAELRIPFRDLLIAGVMGLLDRRLRPVLVVELPFRLAVARRAQRQQVIGVICTAF